MRKTLYVIGLSSLVFSCGTQKNVTPTPKKVVPAVTNTAPKPVPTQNTTTPKPTIQKENGVDFYTQNIADITKNNNTISYGSIVTAKPAGYNVTKTYFPSVGQNFRQRYLILHYTALNNDRSITELTQNGLSAHYLVSDIDDKDIYQIVDEDKRAYHAGISNWRKDSNLNDTSIGIEIVNMGYTADASGQRQFADFPDYQVKKVAALAKDIITRYNIPATNVLAHSDIAPTRKQDPGPKFPWKLLYDQYQIGMWYDEATKSNFLNQISQEDFDAQKNTPQFIYKVQSLLASIGYSLEQSGQLDTPTKATIQAFQYHFRPQQGDGLVDRETYAIMQALAAKYGTK